MPNVVEELEALMIFAGVRNYFKASTIKFVQARVALGWPQLKLLQEPRNDYPQPAR